MLTKSQVNRTGRSLRKNLQAEEAPEIKHIELLQEYRTSYKPDVANVFSRLAELSKKIRSDRVVSFRIKRIESILSKIRREPTMALANMGDIAGCRCILRTSDAVRKVVEAIQNEFIVVDENDYLTIAKSDGYRGYHLYIQSPIDKNRKVEIQVRSLECHNWATLVEIIDILYDLKIKEGQKVSDLNRFLWLMSKKDVLSLAEKREIIKIDKERNIYSKLNSVFLSNYIPIRRKWLEISRNTDDPYFIIEVDEKKESHISCFPNYNTAEKEYYSKFTNKSKSNFVLTHLDKATFKKVCIAYSNYILIKHEYLNDWNKIVTDLMEYNFKQSNKKEFDYYYDYIDRNFTDSKIEIDKEISEIRQIVVQHKDSYELFPLYGLNEWIDELEKMSEERENFTNKLEKMRNELPSSFWDNFKKRT